MNPHIDDSGEIGVFDAARYFSGDELHGIFSTKNSIVDTQSMLKALDLPKNESHLVLQKANDQKKISKAKIPSTSGVRLSVLFNSLFHQSNSNSRNKQKQLERSTVSGTIKSYPLSPKTYTNLMHYSQCSDGFSGELWRDRRLDGIVVVGKRWVLNNYANDGGLCYKSLLGEVHMEVFSESKKENGEDDDSSSVASSELFELENCN